MRNHCLRSLITLSIVVLVGCLARAESPRYSDPAQVDADFAFQGEYAGLIGDSGDQEKFGVQVIALGKGRFEAVGYHGGLPGDGWNREKPIRTQGELKDGAIKFVTDEGTGELRKDEFKLRDASGNEAGSLKKVERSSPTLGQKPPPGAPGAVVLFDGTKDSLQNWQNGRMTEDGLLMEGTTSQQRFGDHTIHFEFRLAYQPADRGQGRSNSGIYVQGRYEVQILDSFGLEGKHNECGGIYSVRDPSENLCFPPLAWQTFDFDYSAAKYDEAGKLATNPRISVRHNGVLVHDDVELPGDRSTTAAPVKPGPEPGPVYLQNHGCPLRYRNIWILGKG